jgi:hypothetical protein
MVRYAIANTPYDLTLLSSMKNYRVLISQQTYQRAIDYLAELKAGDIPGAYLKHKLKTKNIDRLSAENLSLRGQTL